MSNEELEEEIEKFGGIENYVILLVETGGWCNTEISTCGVLLGKLALKMAQAIKKLEEQ